MPKKISFAAVCCAALLVASGLKASEWNRKSTVTFSEPVELSGTVLPAGTYVLKLADTGLRTVVQVLNTDENHIYTTVIGIPAEALKPIQKARIGLEERPAGAPEALHDWFYPGALDGVAFPHP